MNVLVNAKSTPLEKLNQRLKLGKVPVRVIHRRDRLYLRATLPPKPGSGHTTNHRYELSLGIPANPDGLRRAEAEAQQIGAKLALDKFDWDDYLKEPQEEAQKTAEVIAEYKKDYFSRNKIAESTWERHYIKAVFGRLPQNKPLTADAIVVVATRPKPDTRERLRACRKLQGLADFARVDVDLDPYKGSYGPRKVKPRHLPSDKVIEQWYEEIPAKSKWRIIYARIATFGLRPHEAFFFELAENEDGTVDPYTAIISEGKTGTRITQALPKEWAENWEMTGELPPISWRTFQNIGERCLTQFYRYGVPFLPYDLRHAWCVRGLVRFGMEDQIMADFAGHDVQTHIATYTRWIPQETKKQIYEKKVLGKQHESP